MRIERKIVRMEMFGGLVIRKVVQQNSSENGALRLHICGHAAGEVVVGSGHVQVKFREEVASMYA
jgi:hypothetical protein